MTLGLKNLSGQTTELDDEQSAMLRMSFRGRLLAPQDDGYDQARVVQNGLMDRRPGLIVRGHLFAVCSQVCRLQPSSTT